MPTDPLLPTDALERLKALRVKATPGEWRYVPADNVFVTSASGKLLDVQPRSHVDVPVAQRNANAEYIAALHNLFGRLIEGEARTPPTVTPRDITSEIDKPGFSLLRCVVLLRGVAGRQILLEELAQLVNAFHEPTPPRSPDDEERR